MVQVLPTPRRMLRTPEDLLTWSHDPDGQHGPLRRHILEVDQVASQQCTGAPAPLPAMNTYHLQMVKARFTLLYTFHFSKCHQNSCVVVAGWLTMTLSSKQSKDLTAMFMTNCAVW